MSHPYLKEFEILNGVSTLEENTEYVVYITNKKETGVFGVCRNEGEALHVVERVGKAELKRIKGSVDENWTKVESVHEEGGLTYEITVQELGRLKNGPVKVDTRVFMEEVPSLHLSEYEHDVVVDGPKQYETVEEELKDHPLVYKE